MSVSAHVITKLEYGETRFNFWNDELLMDYLRERLGHQLNDDNCGFCEISHEWIEEIIKNFKKDRKKIVKTHGTDNYNYTLGKLEEMLEDTKINATEYSPGWARYWCF